MKIVLVEDSPVVRERLVAMVSELRGATIVGYVKDADRARESIGALQPDVMILDIQLSRGNGIEVLREVKRMPHAPVAIMLTNLVSAECRAACREAVVEFFVDKSFGDEQLAGILKGLAVHA
jgi:CheY-like chemotaxis protein